MKAKKQRSMFTLLMPKFQVAIIVGIRLKVN